jgi:CubicO group peptidase (beta-lactamase class C family)
MTAADFTRAGLSPERFGRLRAKMADYAVRGEIPGIVTAVSRRGETFVDAHGTLAAGGSAPMQRDTIVRIASVSKPIVAVGAMILVEECRLRLDDPIDPFIPELADRRVLARLDGPVDETVPADRPITTRDLLTMRMGFGPLMLEPGDWPIAKLLQERGLLAGPNLARESPEEWLKRLGSVPWLHQPGPAWQYDMATDVLGVLVARAAGQSLGTFLRERIFEPLGMHDTGFSVSPEQIHRLATCYASDHEHGGLPGGLRVRDEAEGGWWSRPPVFESARGGLASTADDLLAFATMMLNRGEYNGRRILSRPTVEAMTTNQIDPEHAAGQRFILSPNSGWGLVMAVTLHRDRPWSVPGQFGWDGGYGTSWASDPAEQLTGILLTQRMWDAPGGPTVYHDFWSLAYQSIAD